MTKAKQEWAIRDEAAAAGQWWSGGFWGDLPIIYGSYLEAAQSAAWKSAHGRGTARIVEAPVREMSDEEAWSWFSRRTHISLGALHVNDIFREWVVFQDSDKANIGRGPKPCDAIRAAAKKIGA